MEKIDQIAQSLKRIEDLLQQMVERDVAPTRINPQPKGIYAEIAMVRAAGGDLVQHFKNKAKAQMREEKRK